MCQLQITNQSNPLLQALTQESAVIDIPCPKDIAISPLQCLLKLYTGYWGLILPGTVGLLLGLSSLSIKVIVVHTGIINDDYIGKTAVMITVPTD